MYHLSDSMIVRSAFAKVKAGCFLHVKMAAAVADAHCCSDFLNIFKNICNVISVGAHIGPEPTTDRFVVITVSSLWRCQIPCLTFVSSSFHILVQYVSSHCIFPFQ